MTTSTTNPSGGVKPNPYASASLYVGDLSPETTEATLFELFNAVGPVASIRVCRDATTRKSLGYAYVNFHSVADADRALDTMNFTNIKGKQCRIMWSQRDPSIRKSGKGNVFVKDLHEEIDNKTLYDTFSVFGSILSCKIVTDRETGASRGYGYVHYVNPEDAKKAIEGVNGMVIRDKVVRAELFKPRQEREKSLKFTNVYIKYIPEGMTEEDLHKLIVQVVSPDKKFEDITSGNKFWEHPYGKCACINFGKNVDDPDKFTLAKTCVEKLNGYDVSSYIKDDKEKEENDNNTDEKENKEDENKENTTENKKTQLFVARCQKKKDRERLKRGGRSYGGGSRGGNRYGTGKYAGINLYVKNLHPTIDDDELKKMFGDYGKIVSARVMRDNTGKSRGFGFVSFQRKEDATKAMFEMNSKVFSDKPLYVSRAQKKEQRRQFLAKQRSKIQQNPNFNMGGYPPQFGGRPMGYNPNMHPFNQQFVPPFGQPPHMHPMQQMRQGQPPNMPFGRPPYGFPNQNMMVNPNFQPRNQIFPFQVNPQLQQQLQQNQQSQQQQQQQNSSLNQTQLSRTMQSGPQIRTSSVPQPFPNQTGMVAPVPVSTQVSSQPTQQSTSQMQNSNPVVSGQHQQSSQPQPSTSQINPNQQSVTSQLSAPQREQQPLTSGMLTNAEPAERKRLIGERLFPKIQEIEPRLAGKITGMLLEMDNTELLVLLDKKEDLVKKINEALGVLKEHREKQSQRNEQPDSAAQRTSTGNPRSIQNQSQQNQSSITNQSSTHN